jgi:type II secretory pathway component PulF
MEHCRVTWRWHSNDTEIVMDTSQLVPALMFMTLGAVIVIAVLQLIWFLRRRRNRDIAKDALLD